MPLSAITTDDLVQEIESRGFVCRIWASTSGEELNAEIALDAWRRRVLVGYRYPTPSGRVAAILRRLSRERVLNYLQYLAAVEAAARRHSRTWWNTANTFTEAVARHNFYGFYRGRRLSGPSESYAELVTEARHENRQFCSIAEYRKTQIRRVETACERNRELINNIKKEIKNVSENRNGRPTSPVPRKHADRREVGRHQTAGSRANAEARGAD